MTTPDDLEVRDQERIQNYLEHKDAVGKWILFLAVLSGSMTVALFADIFTREAQLYAAMPIGVSLFMIAYHMTSARFNSWRAVGFDPSDAVAVGTVTMWADRETAEAMGEIDHVEVGTMEGDDR